MRVFDVLNKNLYGTRAMNEKFKYNNVNYFYVN